jgi:hypothetical protein
MTREKSLVVEVNIGYAITLQLAAGILKFIAFSVTLR